MGNLIKFSNNDSNLRVDINKELIILGKTETSDSFDLKNKSIMVLLKKTKGKMEKYIYMNLL